MAIAFCPDCDGSVSVGPRPRLGQRVTCSHCGAELEVIEVSPLELDWAYAEPEVDWEDGGAWDDGDEDDDEDEDDQDDDWDGDDV
jgi:lysine biosynthesis protein LysW